MTVKDTKVRPMLALSDPIDPRKDLDPKRGPWWVSPKLDGIRSMNINGDPRSRTLKPHANLHVQKTLTHPDLHGLDGELVVGSATAPDCINKTTSAVNGNKVPKPEFTYHVFDLWDTPKIGFRQRYGTLKRKVLRLKRAGFPIELVPQRLCHTIDEVVEAVNDNYDAGYEGSIVRHFDDPYKYNRSTLKEGYLLKVKESIDFEVQITELFEMEHNDNEAKLDERGYTKRTTHKANKRAAGTLGKMKGVRVDTGEVVTVGRGKMTAAEAQHVWDNPKEYLGLFAKCRSGKHGVKDKPRFPRFIVWRDATDF